MSIEVDPQHPWRAASLACIPVTRVVIDFSDAGALPEQDEGESESFATWQDSTMLANVPRQLAAQAYNSKLLAAKYEVRNTLPTADVTGCVSVRVNVDYDYFTKATNCAVTSDGDHMAVAADINASTRGVLRTACSVEEVAKAAGIKLPRVMAQSGQRSSPLSSNAATPNDFEVLRGVVMRKSTNSDYGLRLFQLARIVCHATVLSESGLSGNGLVNNVAINCSSIMVAQTPLLTPNDLNTNSFWYIGAEASPAFRAFLYLGAAGVENHTTVQTVYSAATTGCEIADSSRVQVVFVRVGSLAGNVAPTQADFNSVLSSPDQCLAYYMAYANLVGVGEQAAEILQQVAVLPHLVGEDCRLPYKPDYPCIDAAPYLFSSGNVVKTVSPADLYNLVAAAAIRALQVKVGLGARIGGFSNSAKVDASQVMSQTMWALSDYKSARTYVYEVLRALGDGESGLEWVSPFFPDLISGVNGCVTAYRAHAWLLSTFQRNVVGCLDGVFFGGVDMRSAVFAGSGAGGKFRETVITQLASRRPTSLLCDKQSQQSVPRNVYSTMGYMRSWRAVCKFVQFCADESKVKHASSASTSSTSSVVKASTPSFLRRRSRMSEVGPNDSASVAPEKRTRVPRTRTLSPPARGVRALSPPIRGARGMWGRGAYKSPPLQADDAKGPDIPPLAPLDSVVERLTHPDPVPPSTILSVRDPATEGSSDDEEESSDDEQDGSPGSTTVRTVVGLGNI